MTVQSSSTGDAPGKLSLRMGAELRFSDDELLVLCARNPELRIERSAEGDLIVATPSGGATGHRNLEIISALAVWARADGSGVGFDSSTGFVLPNGAMRAPDAAWVRSARLEPLSAETKERFLPLCPDFVVGLRSPSDAVADLQTKIEEYLANGARLGWLIDPLERRVFVYRPGRPSEVLNDPLSLSGDPELPGLVLELAPVFRPL